jgi:hypothetical protein
MGIHTIISTVTGAAQVELINAAVAQGVKRFAPAEFEGTPGSRDPTDPLDRGKKTVRDWLDHYRHQIQSTIFTCGVLYERFAPGGLHGMRIGLNIDYGHEGDYIINVRNLKANAPIYDANGNAVKLCLTAAQDVAMMVVRALDMKTWPKEQSVVGEKMTVQDLLQTVARVRGMLLCLVSLVSQTHTFTGRSTLHPESQTPSTPQLAQELIAATDTCDEPREIRVRELIATVNRRYVYSRPDRTHNPIRFEQWLSHHWSQHPVDD